MGKLKAMTVEDFIQITSSDAPAPGGGSISALAGALSAALSEMVSRLTAGREKYAASETDMQHVMKEASEIREMLTEAIDRDSDSFNQYMAALALPKATEEEKAARREAMQEGLKAAAEVPLGVAKAAVRLLPLAYTVVTKGNTNAITDSMVAAMMARSAVLGAVFNVRINLLSIKDEAYVKETYAVTEKLVAKAIAGEKEVLRTQQIAGDC